VTVPVDGYLREAARLVDAVDADAVRRAADVLLAVHDGGGVVFACGNGGSASTASHFTADIAKYAGGPSGHGLRAICLNDNPALASAWANDAGFDAVYSGQLEQWITAADVLVAFSVHGGPRAAERLAVSSNLLGAAQVAKDAGAQVIGLTGFDGGGLGELADVHLNVPCGSEPLATPLIESLHVLVHHAICSELRERGVGRSTRQIGGRPSLATS
jgi:D-sedoheptulose 7-phosphate isomerase